MRLSLSKRCVTSGLGLASNNVVCTENRYLQSAVFLLTSDEKSVHYRSFGEAPASIGALFGIAQDGENEKCLLK